MNTHDTQRTSHDKLIARTCNLGTWASIAAALLLVFLLATSYRANAQWSNDPAAPMVLCNATGVQTGLKVISDGGNGWFAFWVDRRSGQDHGELYGQHVDSAGYAAWPANGQLIFSVPDSNLTDLSPLLLTDGSLLVACTYQAVSGAGSVVKALHLDADGNNLWPAPVEIVRASAGPLGNINNFGGLKTMLSGDSAYIAWAYTPQGGNSRFAYERIALDGGVQFGSPGNGVPNTDYSAQLSIHDDLAGGIIFVAKVGIGSPLMAIRMDAAGNAVWPSSLLVSTNTTGMQYTYASDIAQNTVVFNNGELLTVFMSGGDLPMARYDTSGSFVWTPTPYFACNESHGQNEPRLLVHDGHFFVGWADNRPPAANEDMYVQKFDMDGTPLWAADGVPVIQVNTYIPTPDLVASDSGGVIATFDGSAAGFAAMRLHSDGTLAWPAPVLFTTVAFNPSYEARVVIPDGEGGVVAFWEIYGGDLYAARVYRDGSLDGTVGIGERASAQEITAWPNPTQDRITFRLPAGERIMRIELIDVLGATKSMIADDASIATDQLASGAYTARIHTADKVFTTRFIKQ